MKTIDRINKSTTQKTVNSILKEIQTYSMAPKNFNRVVLAAKAKLAELKGKAKSKRGF